ncbi:MAG: M15 family metallopeptidase [Spirochaetales bacterium]|nr:M15 family metallopeptidase [Spirochaetales bacterium]
MYFPAFFTWPVVFVALCMCAGCGGSTLHPEFNLTRSDIEETTKDLPAEIGEAIRGRPVRFCELMAVILDEPQELMLLVDKTHSLPPDYEPADLVSVVEYSISAAKPGLRLRKIAIDNLIRMSDDAAGDGAVLTIASAYRSYAYQEQVHRHWIRVLGKERAQRESAEPGHSQHQLGTTIDFEPIGPEFAGTPASAWLTRHAPHYGFSLSYPEGREEITGYIYEPWHYRYIGGPACLMIGEFFSNSQHYFLRFYNDNAAFFREKRKQRNG